MDSHVLVTGCAGFLGFHAATAMLARGCKVYGLDNMSASYYSPLLKRSRLRLLLDQGDFEFIESDLAEGLPRSIERDRVRHVLHLAADAAVLPSFDKACEYIRNNVLATQRLFDWASTCSKLEHLIYASSSSVYGTGERDVAWRESAPLLPISPYGATKVANEAQAQVLYRSSGVPVTGLRFFKVYGPWGRPDTVFYRFIDRLYRGKQIELHNHGEIEHAFTFIDDAMAGLMAALGQPPESNMRLHPVYNLAGKRRISLIRALDLIENFLGKTGNRRLMPLPTGDRSYSYADITKAERELGFRNSTSIEEGLRNLVDWYLDYHAETGGRRPGGRH